ncbi:dehydrogenase/reductase (SDR family) member 7Cb [Pungitius pungitius]|uniref:dehydrogenase/reductase (SDR family) member 7Cb n=1 Tax=Pungitius pungitius TaxID=134920 RepID=UPI002E1608EB
MADVDVLIFNSSMKLKSPIQIVSLNLDRNVRNAMDVNYFSPSTLDKGVLPAMISRLSGHIVLINGIQGGSKRLILPPESVGTNEKPTPKPQDFFDCLRFAAEEYGIIVSTISHTFIKHQTQLEKI